MVKRTPVPSLGLARARPSDLIFQGPTEPAPASAPANVKLTVYLPPALLADVDAYRTALLRKRGRSVDRSRVLRDLVRSSLDSAALLQRLLRDEQ